ncbi:hypothetical protein HYT45_01055 [Candidatus Uhrbacteria bacterium]|nr:hypothetical protein [Candidatus Uhrbacteria bacterium]
MNLKRLSDSFMRFWKVLIKATIGTVIPAAPGFSAPPKTAAKNASMDGIIAMSKTLSSETTKRSSVSSASKKTELMETINLHRGKIQKIRREYKKLVEKTQKELEKIKAEKIKEAL